MKFVDYCESHRIIAAILPPKSTHRLQPLDVGIFSPLSMAYSNEIDRLIQRSHGFSRITKRTFWSLFYAAWKTSLTKANIQSAFEATGIVPFNPAKTLSQVQKRTPSPSPNPTDPKTTTPGSVRAVRRMAKAIKMEENRLSHEIEQLIKASEKLAITNEILAHENQDLRSTLVEEKRRRKRGKAMGLLDPDQPGQAQFFSPNKVALARERAAEIEQEKEQNRIEIEERRIERENKKKEKAREVEERRKMRLQVREEKRLEKELRKQEREEAKLRKLAEKQQSQAKATSKKRTHVSPSRKTPEEAITVSESPERPKQTSTRSGRNIRTPRWL
jgi:DDE superfamily endonuclease